MQADRFFFSLLECPLSTDLENVRVEAGVAAYAESSLFLKLKMREAVFKRTIISLVKQFGSNKAQH